MLSIGAKIADMGSSKISQECWDVWLVERNCVLESIVRWMLPQRKFKQWIRWSAENGGSVLRRARRCSCAAQEIDLPPTSVLPQVRGFRVRRLPRGRAHRSLQEGRQGRFRQSLRSVRSLSGRCQGRPVLKGAPRLQIPTFGMRYQTSTDAEMETNLRTGLGPKTLEATGM
ncbi:hypothetical protein AVEN_269266-1 [Araneus ventricosus]|uniref:Uncharacterized protein n=1 Tax=Araneus ventricosus TaxID=182803 RepID=A0A4Y2SLQ3_ARAVE|nr:hypothetical protein AVEN_269266-1 [Araneus ventricosus]